YIMRLVHNFLATRRRKNFYFSSRRRHTRFSRDWSSDVCSSDLCVTIAGPATSSTVTTAVAVVLLPFTSTTVKVTVLSPISEQSKSVISRVIVSIAQLSVEPLSRSEERRVGKECRYRWCRYQ